MRSFLNEFSEEKEIKIFFEQNYRTKSAIGFSE